MDNEILDLMTKMYAEMQKGFKQVDLKFNQVNDRIDKLESEVKDVKKTVINIEQNHGDKLSALFDGYKQNSEKLDHIEKEVSKHEEVILRRIR